MAKSIHCSECGIKLTVFKKAIKGYGRIISLIAPHTCLEEPIEIDLKLTNIPAIGGVDGKFVQKLNELNPSQVNKIELCDKRKGPEIKTLAPATLLDQMSHMQNSVPENVIEDSN